MELQDFLKKYRRENNITMQELAQRCGLSKGYISMLESGKHPQNQRQIVPSIETYGKLASGMNMQLDELLRAIDGNSVVGVGRPRIDLQFFADEKVKPVETDGLTVRQREFIRLVSQLSDQEVSMLSAQVKGLLQSQGSQDDA